MPNTSDTGRESFAITPHDTNPISRSARSLYVGSAGNVTIVTPAGVQVTYSNVPAGTQLNCGARLVKATGTTASAIVGQA